MNWLDIDEETAELIKKQINTYQPKCECGGSIKLVESTRFFGKAYFQCMSCGNINEQIKQEILAQNKFGGVGGEE